MRTLRQIPIGAKLYLLVGVVFLFSITIAFHGMVQIDRLGDEIKELAGQDVPMVHLLTRISLLHAEREQWLQQAVRLGVQTPASEKSRLGFQTSRQRFDEQTAGLADLVRQGRELVQEATLHFMAAELLQESRQTLDHMKQVGEAFRQYEKNAGEILNAVALQNHDQALALLEQMDPQRRQLADKLHDFLEELEIFTKTSMHKVEEDERATFRGMQLLILLGLTIGGLFSFILARMISRPLVSLSATMREVAQSGDFSRQVAVFGSDEVAMVGMAFNQLAQRTVEQAWLKSGLSRLNGVLQAATTPDELARRLIREALAVTDSTYGAVYVLDEAQDHYLLIAQSGGSDALPSLRAMEGIPGRAAAEKGVLVVQDIPPDFAKIRFSLGDAQPTAVVAMPMVFKDMAVGILELAAFHPFSPLAIELLASLAPTAGMSLQQLRQAANTHLLLLQTQRQAEELEEQARALKAAEEELTSQNELLENQNAELESTQKELEEQMERVARASRYKSEFLANMSHELRTPLNSLLLLSRNLAGNADGNLTDDQVKTARIIHDSGQDLLRLVNDILDLAKVEAGRMDLHAGPVELQEFLSEIHHLYQPLAQERGLAFHADLQEGVPRSLTTDGRRLKQILQNLLSNALKFTHQGQVTLLVRTEGRQRLAFVVQDTGIGISRPQKEMIFEAFQQGDGAITRQYGGTGLGLTISRGLARLLGGEIRVESEEGHGSTFTLLLPMGTAAQPTRPVRAGNLPFVRDDREGLAAGEGCLLIIEDDAVFAAEVGRIARSLGLRFLATQRGEDGVTLARQHRPRGIILDLGLPDMDGLQVREMLATHPATRDIPIHVVSARDPEPQGVAPNIIGHLVKPAGSERIAEAIRLLVSAADAGSQRLLLVTGQAAVRQEIEPLLAQTSARVVTIDTWRRARELLQGEVWRGVILHIARQETAILDDLLVWDGPGLPALILYTDEPIASEMHLRLRGLTDSVIVRGARSLDRLRADILLFLHSVQPVAGEGTAPVAIPYGDALFQGRVILLVDDDVRSAYALAKSLKEKGIKVLMAPNGRKAMDILERESGIDIVLMDVMMPVQDGYQTMRLLRADPRFRTLPMLALTAKAMPGDREDALAAGANDYLAKPIQEERLFAMLRVWLHAGHRDQP